MNNTDPPCPAYLPAWPTQWPDTPAQARPLNGWHLALVGAAAAASVALVIVAPQLSVPVILGVASGAVGAASRHRQRLAKQQKRRHQPPH
jgi:hypothetical protein